MRSVLYYRHGVPSEVLETVEVPAPAPPPPGHVVVRVRMRPVHYGDLLGIAGRYRSAGDLPVPPEERQHRSDRPEKAAIHERNKVFRRRSATRPMPVVCGRFDAPGTCLSGFLCRPGSLAAKRVG